MQFVQLRLSSPVVLVQFRLPDPDPDLDPEDAELLLLLVVVVVAEGLNRVNGHILGDDLIAVLYEGGFSDMVFDIDGAGCEFSPTFVAVLYEGGFSDMVLECC